MLESLDLNPSIRNRLERQAQANNCTVDELIESLLDLQEAVGSDWRTMQLKFQGAVQAGQVGLWDWNFITDVASYSDEWKKVLGYEPYEFEDKHENFLKLVHPDDLPYLATVIEITIAEVRQNERVEFRMFHKDGTYRWIMSTGSIITNQDGVPERLIGAIIDITQQKYTEEALRQSEKRYRKVIENLNDMCVLYDTDLNIVMVNQVTVDYTGLPREELVGYASHRIFATDNAKDYIGQLHEVLRTRKARTGEMTFTTLYGDRALIFKHIPILSDQKKIENIVSITHDITEHQKNQAHEFELMLEKERSLLLSEFVQDTAHEFRTPLSTIKSNTYLMKRTGLSNAHQLKAEQIDLQIARMQRLVDTLLMMTKLDNNDELTFTTIDIRMLMKRICEDAKEQYNGQMPEFICDIDHQVPIIYGDVSYLTEAIKQLINNAIRFTPEDGRITIATQVDEEMLELSITDTGIGISEEVMPHIFKTFWRQDEAHTTPGFGLGLSIAQKIITLHQGTIDITSTPNEGTTVRIVLPLATL